MKTVRALTGLLWPPDGWADALRAVARATRVTAPARFRAGGGQLDANKTVAESLPALARTLGLDVEPVDVPFVDPLALLRRQAPLVMFVASGGGLLVLLRARGRTATMLGPNGAARAPLAVVEDALWAPLEGEGPGVDARVMRMSQVVAQVGVLTSTRRIAAARALMAPSLSGRPLGEGWTIRPTATGMGQDLKTAKVHQRFAGIVAGYLVQLVLFLAIWRQVGAHVFVDGITVGQSAGHGWGGFTMLLGLWVLVQLVVSGAISRLALDIGAVVRAGLMRGALRLDPEAIRMAGVGQLLGRALDAEVIDVLALGGGVETVAGGFELVLAAGILFSGATPGWSLALLGLVLVGLATATLIHARLLISWCRARRALTHDLVERMIGHRTALIQDLPRRRVAADTAALHGYDRDTRALDRAEVWLSVGLQRFWLLAGLLALVPLAVSPSQNGSAQAIALSLAGVWFAFGALRRLGIALPTLSMAREAWGQVAPLIGAVEADVSAPSGGISVAVPAAAGASNPRVEHAAPLLDLDAVAYHYPNRLRHALENVTFAIAAGDRVLIEGVSGGGKSTLASLLTGLKPPSAGRLRLRGIDQRSIGLNRWRRAVGGAPQFHDNHVFGADLLFNLLMGRRWPPRMDDVVAATRVCQELGLAPLLGRMPGGIAQQVGETGWQLSHGERSRLFIARSLLQVLDARVLDESFAALDPETLDEVLAAVLSRPEALIVIAHP